MSGLLSAPPIAGDLSLHRPRQAEIARLCAIAGELFETHVWGWSCPGGRLLYPADQPAPAWSDLVAPRLLGLGPNPDLLDEDDDRVLVGARFPIADDEIVLIVPVGKSSDLGLVAQLEGTTDSRVWSPDAVLRTLKLLQLQTQTERQLARRQRELDALSAECTRTYEEISLLHHLASNLRVSDEPEHLAELAVDWIHDCLPANAVAIELFQLDDDSELSNRRIRWSTVSGPSPITDDQIRGLFESLGLDDRTRPLVINSNNQFASDSLPAGLHQLVAVPIVESQVVFGHVALLNHVNGGEFGTIEASLLASIASILGVHAGNCRLYGKQASLLESVVKAMVSAIDAKDPYTCGHSNRVARISVRLARQLELNDEDCDTVYLSGLLHDIGKIGVDDAVLQKTERLTAEEFEHIKRHPELGAKILADIEQFADILPGVLHHHEQWNGKGYPAGLAGLEIPLIARIIAVADSYDAMTSDRPYRKGMPVDRVEGIFQDGRARQWDAAVVDAYFAARNDILDIIRQERADLPDNLSAWTTQQSKSLRDSNHSGTIRDSNSRS